MKCAACCVLDAGCMCGMSGWGASLSQCLPAESEEPQLAHLLRLCEEAVHPGARVPLLP